MMLDFLGEAAAAERIRIACQKFGLEGVAGSTSSVGDAIADLVRG